MTKIEWTEVTWNPIVGCSLASPGCTNCYAMKFAGTRLGHVAKYDGLTQPSKAGPVWTGKLHFDEKALLEPLRWKRPRMVFVNSMGDLFHEDCTDEQIDRVFAVMALCPQHTFQVLTKRSARMREYLSRGAEPHGRMEDVWLATSEFACVSPALKQMICNDLTWGKMRERWPLPNGWLGVSVEDQQRADERIPDLLATPAAVRWISAEPLLGPVSIIDAMWSRANGMTLLEHLAATIDWVVVGGESGKGARPMHPDWARSLRDQCAAAAVPFFFKQWGEFAPGEIAGAFLDPEKPALGFTLFDNQWSECWSEVDGHCDDEPDVYRVGKKRAGRLLDGVEHNGMPGQTNA